MSMLTLVQSFCRRTGLPVPTSVLGSSDAGVLQVLGLLEEEGRDLSVRNAWERMTMEASLTTVATESQGAMTSIATNGFDYIKNDVIWDRTNRLPVLGPVSGKDWQAMKAIVSTGPRYEYRIRGGNLLVNPTPTAGYSWYFEYVSKNWILGVDGVTYKDSFTLDTDTLLLPESLVQMGLRWRWKKEKGFEYAEDMRTYEIQVKDTIGHDGGKKTLYMDSNNDRGPVPGIFISPYNTVP